MRAQALAHEVIIDRVDLEALETFLTSDSSPPDSMMLSELDGFLTGIAIGPKLIRPSEWLPLIWGGPAPEFAGLDEANAILGSLMARYNEIVRAIADDVSRPHLLGRSQRRSHRHGLGRGLPSGNHVAPRRVGAAIQIQTRWQTSIPHPVALLRQ
jgi:hypothetical protein